jgi:AhpD family alkylhydroperoxidase
MTATVEVFDPSMCCSTGVCGPSVDPLLPRFAADLNWLAEHGAQVIRHNLAQEPAAFASDSAVQAALTERGTDCLPLILVDGRIVSQGTYPTRAELASWTGLDGQPAPTLYSESVAELVAIGAAIAANCEPCLKYHYDQAHKLGVSKEDMARAVATAQRVKDAPAKAMLELADKYLGVTTPRGDGVEASKSSCCGPSAVTNTQTTSAPAPAKSGCCP